MVQRRIRIYFATDDGRKQAHPFAAVMGYGSHRDTEPGGRFDRLRKWALENIAAVNEARNADVIFSAPGYVNGKHERNLSHQAKQLGKPVAFLFSGDDTSPAHIDHGFVYRTSALQSKLRPGERGLPAFCRDIRTERPAIRNRWYSPKPTVGFCGHVSNAATRLLYWLQLRRAKAYGLRLRAKAVRKLQQSQFVDAQLIIRQEFGGGLLRASPDGRERARHEFLENLDSSDYALCIRGAGNFSFRLYEALSAGRIPVLVNTECVLPFDHVIDWKSLCVWVEASELDRLDLKIAEHHALQSPESFDAQQSACRRIWQQYLSPEGCYRQIVTDLLGHDGIQLAAQSE